MPPGRSDPFGGFGIEQEPVGDADIGLDPLQIVGIADGERLHDRQSVDRLDCQDTLRAFIAMKLEHVRRQRRDDLIEIVAVGIDCDGHDLRLAANAIGKRAGIVRLDIARALRERR